MLDLIQEVRSRGMPVVLDQPQHAARLRGERPHPYPPAGPPALRGEPQGLHHVRRGGVHDRREGATARGDGGVSLERLAEDLIARAEGRARYVVAIAGAPASGKSTLSEELLAALERALPGQAALLPMDGYHFDDAVLDELGFRARKGAAHTFDVDGLERDLARVRAGGRDVVVPVFDRSLELARAAARLIRPAHRIVLVEGNYLLLDRPPWDRLAQYFDRTLFLDVPVPELRRRLVERWRSHGRDPVASQAWIDSNDMPNAEAVAKRVHGPRTSCGAVRQSGSWTQPMIAGGFCRRSISCCARLVVGLPLAVMPMRRKCHSAAPICRVVAANRVSDCFHRPTPGQRLLASVHAAASVRITSGYRRINSESAGRVRVARTRFAGGQRVSVGDEHPPLAKAKTTSVEGWGVSSWPP